MVTQIVKRCLTKTIVVDVPIRSGKVYFQAFPKAYILASAASYLTGCVATELIPGAKEHPFLSAPSKGAFVYYSRAVPKGEAMGFKTATGFFNGIAYAVLGDCPILIEPAETAIVNVVTAGEVTLKLITQTLSGLAVGLSIFGLSKVAKAINEDFFSEPVKELIETAFNASNVDMCLLGEADEY